jgi:hypothetical protein
MDTGFCFLALGRSGVEETRTKPKGHDKLTGPSVRIRVGA